MEWKFSANAGFFGLRRDRFNQYQPPRSLEERFALVSKVEGLTGIELKYPKDFEKREAVRGLLAQHGLELAAVNVDIKDVDIFHHGALSAPDPQPRGRAVGLLKAGMDVAAEFGVPFVTTCPVMDGYDYPFQVDYGQAWENFIESVTAVTAHRRDVALLLEFQPHDPYGKILLNNVGKVLHVCAEVGAPNLGANLDVGHSFAAGEAPAEAAALLGRKGLLRYLHSNDNTGEGGDWDMLSGAVHFWHWLELLYTLRKSGYEGWIGADLAPRHSGPVEMFHTNLLLIRRMTALLDRLGMARLETLVAAGDPAAAYAELSAALVN